MKKPNKYGKISKVQLEMYDHTLSKIEELKVFFGTRNRCEAVRRAIDVAAIIVGNAFRGAEIIVKQDDLEQDLIIPGVTKEE
jgi:hypothetical protein